MQHVAGFFIVLQDRSFTFILKTPPASVLLLKAAGNPHLLLMPLYVHAFVPWLSLFVQRDGSHGVNELGSMDLCVMHQ